MSAPVRANLTAAEARRLTDEIKQAAERVWSLLLEAHERRAWAVLDYSSWREYATTKFGMAQSSAYVVLTQAEVTVALREASGSNTLKIGQREARDLKPHLELVSDRVREEVANVPPGQVAEVVREVVAEQRERIARHREDREAIQELNRTYAPTQLRPGGRQGPHPAHPRVLRGDAHPGRPAARRAGHRRHPHLPAPPTRGPSRRCPLAQRLRCCLGGPPVSANLLRKILFEAAHAELAAGRTTIEDVVDRAMREHRELIDAESHRLVREAAGRVVKELLREQKAGS